MERGAATAKREGQLENELLRQRVHELQVLKLLVDEYLKAAYTSSSKASKTSSFSSVCTNPRPRSSLMPDTLVV